MLINILIDWNQVMLKTLRLTFPQTDQSDKVGTNLLCSKFSIRLCKKCICGQINTFNGLVCRARCM